MKGESLMPKFGKMPGENISDAKLEAANSRLISKQSEEMLRNLEAEAGADDVSPDVLEKRMEAELERIEEGINQIEGMGQNNPDRKGLAEKLRKDITNNLEYLDGPISRLRISDERFNRKFNKFRAYLEYLNNI